MLYAVSITHRCLGTHPLGNRNYCAQLLPYSLGEHGEAGVGEQNCQQGVYCKGLHISAVVMYPPPVEHICMALPVRKTYGGSKYRCRCRLLPSPSLYPQSKCKYIAGWTWCLLNVFSTSSRADPLCPSPDSCYSSQFSPIVRVFFLS